MKTKQLSPYLTLAGTIPFVACALLLQMGMSQLPSFMPVLGDHATIDVLKVYGIVIASFMAGSHWGSHLHLPDNNHWSSYLPIISNIIAISLWLGWLAVSDSGFLMLLIIKFLMMIMVDWYLKREDIIKMAYFKIRCYVTIIVLLSLIVAVFAMSIMT